MRPWKLTSIFVEIDRCMDKVGFVSFSKAEKNWNGVVVALAIVGIKRFVMLKACMRLVFLYVICLLVASLGDKVSGDIVVYVFESP